jgi:hypothetical protein
LSSVSALLLLAIGAALLVLLALLAALIAVLVVHRKILSKAA